MESRSSNVLEGATADMKRALEICNCLDEWTLKPVDSPLISQVQQHVAKLSALTQSLGKQFSHPLSPRDIHRTHEVANIIHSIKASLSEVLALLDVSSSVETDGDDGALNTVFASLLISNDARVEIGEVCYLTNRVHQACQDLHKLLSPWFGPEATSRNWWWGLEGMSPPDVFQNLAYQTTHDVPYIVDSSALPTQGSYGIVRKVVHGQTQESYAQKTFQSVFSAADRKRILKELGVLELCFHRNIVGLIEAYDVDEDPHNLHIVMTPWAPYTLLQFLRSPDVSRRARCPWFEPHSPTSDICIYRMMCEVTDAICYLHHLSIKHKDIKPDNILLYREQTSEFIPVIADVGISKVFRRGASTDYVKSSYQYLSPEQLRHEESSLKADIWQLGCCFAMLLTVARGGTSALNKLWTTFERTDEKCSCNIAAEHGAFMQTFRDICTPGDASQEHAHSVVCRMLETNPSVRIDIVAIREEVERLPRV